MSASLSAAVRLALRALLHRRFARFRQGLERPEQTQDAVLRRILAGAARSDYGRAHGVTGREDYARFRERVPVVDYEDLRPWIERQAAGGGAVLSAEPVRLYEQTSGSTGRTKLVPYTASLVAAFSDYVALWAYDLLAHGPPLRTGRTFISMSPPFPEARRTPDGTPIGCAEDTEYLSPMLRRLLGRLFVMPAGLGAVGDPFQYRLGLARALLAESRLEIVSVWSPTYWLALLDFMAAQCDLLAPGLPAGRRRLLEADRWSELWPELKLISCWTDAGSAAFVGRLAERFPGVMIQGKGLLATEGPVTLPLLGAAAGVPLVDAVFVEFVSADGSIRRLHELRAGEECSVILTQPAGLLRYRMHDRVRVEGARGRTPCLRFLGRDNQVSDLVGEKLNEVFVREALARAGVDGERCAFLVPVAANGRGSRYVCVTDDRDAVGSAGSLEAELLQAFQYRQARLLGQLEQVAVVYRRDARDRHERHFLSRGLRWGDIKFTALVVGASGAEAEALVG